MNRPVPTFEPLWCACKACGHWWDDWQPVQCPRRHLGRSDPNAPMSHCGKGRRNVLLRTKPLAEKPDDPHAA